MKCKYCGQEVAKDSVYCEYCGKKLRSVKRVDIRWCLLPVVMFMSFLQTYIIEDSYWSTRSIEGYMWLMSLPIAVVFLVTVIGRIAKAVRPSFVILICVMLLTNIGKLIDVGNAYPHLYEDSGYYYYALHDGSEVLCVVEASVLVLYLIYAVIASKKNLNF